MKRSDAAACFWIIVILFLVIWSLVYTIREEFNGDIRENKNHWENKK